MVGGEAEQKSIRNVSMRRARGAHTQDRSRLATDIKTLTLGGSHKPTADGVTGVGTCAPCQQDTGVRGIQVVV